MSARPLAQPTENGVWRALADPTRRAILDLLRAEPLPVGRLTERFELSRFGVMKHLRVLQDAGLVLVETRGRERWNRVNPIPIRELYRRWIHPFEEAQADRLLLLKRAVEGRSPSEENAMTNETLTTLDIMLEVQIEGTPAVVWQALVERTAEWWHADFYTKPGCDRFVIEEKLGGHVFEDWGDGNGLIWGTVIGLESGKLLHVAGDSSREWGGPSRGFLKWTLEGSGNGTLVRFEQCSFGNVSAETRASLEGGWKLLIGECLKAFVEDGAKR